MRHCEVCGAIFRPYKSDNRFCKKRCRIEFHMAQRKLESRARGTAKVRFVK